MRSGFLHSLAHAWKKQIPVSRPPFWISYPSPASIEIKQKADR
jgi:hypothetical protein